MYIGMYTSMYQLSVLASSSRGTLEGLCSEGWSGRLQRWKINSAAKQGEKPEC